MRSSQNENLAHRDFLSFSNHILVDENLSATLHVIMFFSCLSMHVLLRLERPNASSPSHCTHKRYEVHILPLDDESPYFVL